jgi:Cu+-exporting ATPase
MDSTTANTENRLSIAGATCQGCARKIRVALEPLVTDSAAVDVNIEHKTVTLPAGIDPTDAARRITEAGYPSEIVHAEPAAKSGCARKITPSCCSEKDNEVDAKTPAPELVSAASDSSGSNDSDDGIQLAVTGATCASCVSSIEKALKSVSGVTHAHMNLADNTASASGQADAQALISAIESAGYGASVIDDPDAADERRQQQDRKRYRSLLVKMAVSLSLGLGMMIWGMGFGSMTVDPGNQTTWINLGILTLGVMVATGSHFFTSAWKAFIHHNANMDTLVALGTGTAWIYSMVVAVFPEALPEMARHVYFEASAMIIGLINLGQALELRAKGKTSEAVRRLLDLRAKTARVIRDDQEQDLPIEQVRKGDQIRVRPGEQLPVDGVVTTEFKAHAERRVAEVDDIKANEMMLDCGPETVDALADAIAGARTLVWNGPLGAFETPPFDTATVEAARFAARRCVEGALVAVAGGGDTVAALNQAGVADDFTFVSTAGGAFLEWMEGKDLPGVAALKNA